MGQPLSTVQPGRAQITPETAQVVGADAFVLVPGAGHKGTVVIVALNVYIAAGGCHVVPVGKPIAANPCGKPVPAFKPIEAAAPVPIAEAARGIQPAHACSCPLAGVGVHIAVKSPGAQRLARGTEAVFKAHRSEPGITG